MSINKKISYCYYHLLFAYSYSGGDITDSYKDGRGFIRPNETKSAKTVASAISSSFNELHLNSDFFNENNNQNVLVSEKAVSKYIEEKENKITSEEALIFLKTIKYKNLNTTKLDKKTFHWEHAYSRATFTNDLLNILPKDQQQTNYVDYLKNNKDNILDKIEELINKHQIILITKKENLQFTTKKIDNKSINCRWDRSIGWELVYEKCHISALN